MQVTCMDSLSESKNLDSPLLNIAERLKSWREEQDKVASLVVVRPDSEHSDKEEHSEICQSVLQPSPLRYKFFQKCDLNVNCKQLYGGVDVSFFTNNEDRLGNSAVAAYVVMTSTFHVVYQDFDVCELQVPYVSSYLSFREIEPLERLIKNQMKERPDVTPNVILVDGNGLMHAQQAGIACFVGVRTGIPTIGVAKSFCNLDVLTAKEVKCSIHARTHQFVSARENDVVCARVDGRAEPILILDCHPLVPVVTESCGQRSSAKLGGNDRQVFNGDISDAMKTLASQCNAFAVKLQGSSGKTWGAALVGHGGDDLVVKRRRVAGRVGKVRQGTKNAIFISIGHDVALEDSIVLCWKLSKTRIPEPIRAADLLGREIIRNSVDIDNGGRKLGKEAR